MEGLGLDLWRHEEAVSLELVDWHVAKDHTSVLMMTAPILNSTLKEIECNFKFVVERTFATVVVH